MLYGLYLSAAGMQAQEYRQNVTANNLANAQTTGFKRDLAIVQSRLDATREDPQMARYRQFGAGVPQGGGVLGLPTAMDMSQGMLTKGTSDKDLALKGPGFFTVQGDKPGQVLLTRDGHLSVDNEGYLVGTATGRKMLGADGTPIKLANSALPLKIDTRGQITQAGGAAGKLGIVDVKNPGALQKVGSNMLAADAGSIIPADSATEVKQGFLESSGVDPIVEITNMMENQRAFEANAKMITYQDTTLQSLNTVGRVA